MYQKIFLPVHGDERGQLVAIEGNRHIPFDIKRVYYIYGTKAEEARGFHAHKELEQFAICISGSCKIIYDDGKKKDSVLLDSKSIGVTIPKLIWHEMHDFSENCILLVFASASYEEQDYIRNYDEFLKMVNA